MDEDEFLRLNFVQVDLERSKWLLKQIVRSRLDLLQKYAGFVAGRMGERRKLNGSEGGLFKSKLHPLNHPAQQQLECVTD